LETQYFGHRFETDSDDGRLARLEKYVFGQTTNGPLQQRIESLAASTITKSDVTAKTGSPKTVTRPPPSYPKPASGTSSQSTESDMIGGDSNDSINDRYPRINALEAVILGQSYSGEPLAARLERMEVKAFGRASGSPDLSQRSDALDDYVTQHLHKQVVRQDAESETAEGQGQPTQTQAEYPRITALEKAILTQAFPGEPLADRLNRMEVKAFGSVSTNPDMSQRTDALERYAEKKLHKKPEEQHADQTASEDGESSKGNKPLASMIGKSLLGLAGFGGGGGVGMSSSPMLGSGGMGFGGMGMGGAGGMGMGRIRHQQNAQPEPEAQTPEVRKEDPQVYDLNPPPAYAKLITKIGWCEMQVFGQTFSTMHLPERLGKLSQELNFEPSKSNIELMDDIEPLMKASQARKQSGQPIGAGAQSTR
jgi:hypothetical protein